MKFIRTAIPDIIICKPKIFEDKRGYFFESFRQDIFEKFLGYEVKFCQDNESKSSFGVLRGMHYQLPPFSQSKLVRVIEGRVLDIAVDIRAGSPYFGKSVSLELTAENKNQLFIPRGFAHGFVVLSETATFAYKCDNYYNPSHDRGFRYDDEEIGIDWKLESSRFLLSEKDRNLPSFKNAEKFQFDVDLYKSELLT